MFILNKENIIQRAGDIPNIIETLAVIFIDEVEQYVTVLDQALNEGDSQALSHQAHTIKGALATFADDKGVRLAGQLERQIKQQGINPDTKEYVRVLQNRLHEVANVLNKEIL
ncbi:MAG: Hpt domain-containing protein [Enterobacteriaceae bacterium]